MKRKSFSNSKGLGNGIHIQFNKVLELQKKKMICVFKEQDLQTFVLR